MPVCVCIVAVYRSRKIRGDVLLAYFSLNLPTGIFLWYFDFEGSPFSFLFFFFFVRVTGFYLFSHFIPVSDNCLRLNSIRLLITYDMTLLFRRARLVRINREKLN